MSARFEAVDRETGYLIAAICAGLGVIEPGAAAMMGERCAQDKLFGADHLYLDYVGRDTMYGYLAQNRQHLFRDEDFEILYCRNNGRPCVPPSLAVSILFLRAYEGVSFVEAIERTKYDLRWKVSLGLEMEEVPHPEECVAGVSGQTGSTSRAKRC